MAATDSLDTSCDVGMGIAYHARRRPEIMAVQTAFGGRTFGELNDEANRLAHLLRAAGLRAGDALATVDLERVRAILHPGAERSHLRMCNEAGGEICMGTAAHDPQDAGSEFARRMANQQAAEPGRLRILEGYAVGDLNLDIPLKLSREDLDRTLKVITEPLPTYGRDGVLPPSQTVLLAHMTRPVALAKTGAAVGLFGALEVRHVQGPLKADHAYLGRTRMLKLTESPRTENAWYDVDILDAATGKVMATVGFMTRFLKASSPLWAADNGQ